jgi:ABC-type transport system substrate-binding protein
VNEANPTYPGAETAFRRAVYHVYPSITEAQSALADGKVDVILDPTSTSMEVPDAMTMTSPTRNLRYLVFNARSSTFKDAVIRRAIACMLDPEAVANDLGNEAMALTSFLAPGPDPWTSNEAELPCSGLDADSRLKEATGMLKDGGYRWTVEPSPGQDGQGLKGPDGKPVPGSAMMYPAGDDLRANAAGYVETEAKLLGIPLTATRVPEDSIDYAVFSSGDYAAAIVGWQVSPYPGYLCNWFGDGGPFDYGTRSVTSACDELSRTADLASAEQKLAAVQQSLANDVPMVPLFAETRTEAYRNVAYPFDEVLDGLAGTFGAPSLARSANP